MDKTPAESRPGDGAVRAPRGAERSCRGWSQEAALRMLMNGLDPEIAGKQSEPAADGGAGRAARDLASFDAMVRSLQDLENDQTLLVHSGTPIGVFRTHEWAPRVLISCASVLGSWTCIGGQGILHETYRTFAAAGGKHFGGNLAGKLIAAGGMGRTGGAQALAATMNGAAILCVEVDSERIKQWMKRGYCDVMVNSLDEALRILKNAVRKRDATSVGLVGNCADVIPELARRGVVPDLLTDQTGACEPLNGYVPAGLTLDEAAELWRRDGKEYRKRALESIARHVEGMLTLAKLGSAAFEYGNDIWAMAYAAGVKAALDLPDFVSAYLRPLFCEGQGPLRWVALSGEPGDIHRIDRLALEMFGDGDDVLSRWIGLAQKRVRFQGLPARAGWLGYGEPERLGVAINDLVARGELKAPVVIVREDIEMDSAGSLPLEGEAMRARPEASAGWPSLSALLNAASGASWSWVRRGDETGFASRRGGGQVVVADGTKPAGARIERTMGNNSRLGITRLAAAGCPEAVEFARRHGIPTPSAGSETP